MYTFASKYFLISTPPDPHYSNNSCNIWFNMREEVKPMGLFGMNLEIPFCRNNSSRYVGSVYEYENSHRQVILEAVHSFLYQLFGPNVDYQVFSREIPPTLKNIKNTYIEVPKNTTAKELEACFIASPNQEHIHLKGRFEGNLSPNSVIYGAQYLRIDCDYGPGDEILLGFRGKTAYLREKTLLLSTVIQFLNEWKSNKGFHNLKSFELYFTRSGPNFDINEILEHVDIKHFDSPKEFHWSERNFLTRSSPYKWIHGKCRFHDYLIRDSDGQGASVSLSTHRFVFVVWSSEENSRLIERSTD